MRKTITRRGFIGSATAAAAAPCVAGSSALGRDATPAPGKKTQPDIAVAKDMTTNLKGGHIPKAETEMSRRYLMMIQKWVPVGLSYFEDWPGRPNCGHFFGGSCWYGIDTSPPVAALSAVIASPEYDQRITGVSRDELRQIVVKAIRYLCFTHDTGPEDCVRPAAGALAVPALHGTKWGDRGTNFFRESQCGYTISKIVPAALILRPWIDDETWMMLANICADYLDRFGNMAPKSGVYANTQMEENAWTSLGLAASYLFLSRHENAGKWEENAKRWMYSTCSAPQDKKNQTEIENGITAAQLTGSTFTTLPDYMAENHGMVNQKDDGFAAIMVNDLARDSIWQKVLFVSLPNGKLLCSETLTALKDCTVERMNQGFLEIMNENFPKVKGNCIGQRTLYYPGGQKTFKGLVSTRRDDDTSFELNHPGWVNIDNRVGIVFRGTGKTIYRNRHYFKRFRAIADGLFLSLQNQTRKHKTGSLVGELSLLFYPEQLCDETPNQKLIKAVSPDDAVCLITEGYMCAGNFDPKRSICSFKTECEGSIPVFLGTAEINGTSVEYSIPLESAEAVYSKEMMAVKSDGPIKTESLHGGGTYITNQDDSTVQVRATRDGSEEVLDIKARGVARI